MKIKKLAIANRGEVAVRIIRACQELNIHSVLLHSEADIKTEAYRLADEVVCVGGSEVNDSYLNIENMVNGAKSANADAVHPGFGFLSENAEFVRAVEKARMIFVGPSAEAIDLFGDKVSAKNLVEKAGGPVIPGYQGEDQSYPELLRQMERIGFPVMVKAAAGGGGRGLRVVNSMETAEDSIEAAQREGLNAFGSDRVFVEKYLGNAKHIEVQIFVDGMGQVFHLCERECSVQRRHQKIIEEAPAFELPQKVRQEMYDTAKRIAKEAGYKGAGTVEFLYQDNEFYFLEMNTRLQVEHPVTEMILNVDLVKAQILSAQDMAVLWDQDEIEPRGHSIECRLYAEDPYANGMPSTGKVGTIQFPHGFGRRLELGVDCGDEVTAFYDSMIAKVIVWDESRPRAIEKMKTTLKDTVVFGVKTNIPFLLEILSHHEYVSNEMTTQFIGKNFPQGLTGPEIDEDEKKWLESLAKKVPSASVNNSASTGGDSLPNPWLGSW
ncbi:MAG: pyruvate carboxylase subunit A [Bdellovibrionaceae bacterium]|nr:pyruvate carboxylase subunit A [Pseudobdellovibrionaceae bacterium]|tara:strand:+ start:47119 stop:48600 length:1482 start_codon:yes stop_codon:yes gene_type:complete